MIKNDIQKHQEEKRLNEIEDQIKEYESTYSGIDLELLVFPLLEEKQKIVLKIKEYNLLTNQDFEDVINSKTIKPHLIDNIGDLLSKVRIAKKISQEDLAELLGWQQSNLSRFESENYGSQSISKIVEYVSALDVWLKVYPTFSDEEEEVEISLVPIRKTITSLENWGLESDKNLITTDFANN